MEAFKTWAKESGITTFGTTIESTEFSGNGLFSSQSINKDVNVVQIPRTLVLTSTRVLELDNQFGSPIFHYFMEKYDISLEEAKKCAVSEERVVLCLFLIYCQFFSVEENEWEPYFQILPKLEFFEKNHVLFNPDIVKGTCLENSVRAKLGSLERELKDIHAIGEGDWLSKIELNMYLWADCAFWSRAVGVGESGESSNDMALVPFFDLANHSSDQSNIRWELTEDQGIALVTTKDIEKQDEELFLFYGSKPNQELLFLHGFCTNGNPESSRITTPLIPFLNLSNEEDINKLQWLKCVGAKPVLTLVENSTSSNDTLVAEGWTIDSIAALYLISLTEDDGLCFLRRYSDDSQIILQINGKPVDNLDTLYSSVSELDILPLIQLRTTVLLTQALEHQLNMNIENNGDQENSSISLKTHASIYRSEEQGILQRALTQLANLQEKLSNNKLVLSYLAS